MRQRRKPSKHRRKLACLVIVVAQVLSNREYLHSQSQSQSYNYKYNYKHKYWHSYCAEAFQDQSIQHHHGHQHQQQQQQQNGQQHPLPWHGATRMHALGSGSFEADGSSFEVDQEYFLEEEEYSKQKQQPSAAQTTTAKPDTSDHKKKLGPLQKEALDLIKEGHNVFITGVAGTGKSLVLKRAIRWIKKTYVAKEYAALGSTGPAALALEGQTIHSFAGIGIPRSVDDFDKARSRAKMWKELQIIVIDEASMISGEFFDLLSERVSRVRDDPRPMGGIQLVICGDFLQLPPIPVRPDDAQQMLDSLELLPTEDPNDYLFLNRGFLFQSHQWKAAEFQVVELERVYRQKSSGFVSVLDEIRRGQLTQEGMDFLRINCGRPLPPNPYGIRPTLLHSRNIDVSRDNLSELRKLPGHSITYDAVDSVQPYKGVGKWVEKQLKGNQFFNTCAAEAQLDLKIGAQVMLVRNYGPRRIGNRVIGRNTIMLVNGSRGTVVDFVKVDNEKAKDDPNVLGNAIPGVSVYPVVQFVNGAKRTIRGNTFQTKLMGLGTCTREALPLRLAWAITTHKSQGLTLDYVIADLGAVFAEAQAYVAMSRASDESGLELRNFSPRRIRANPIALSFYEDPFRDFVTWDARTVKREAEAPKKEQPQVGTLQGKTVVFLGNLRTISRAKAEAMAEQMGATTRASVTRNTSILVAANKLRGGKPATSSATYQKALQLQKDGFRLHILSESQFVELIMALK